MLEMIVHEYITNDQKYIYMYIHSLVMSDSVGVSVTIFFQLLSLLTK